MPNIDDIPEALDDINQQLLDRFAARADAASEGDGGDGADLPAEEGDQPEGDGGDSDGGPATPPSTPEEGADSDSSPSDDETPSEPPVNDLDQWARRLAPEVRDQFARIEAGTHQAVPRHEFEAYQRWLEGQQGAHDTPQGAQGALDFSQLTPEQAAYVARLEDAARAREQELVAQRQQANAELAQTVDTVTAAYAERHGLDPATVNQLQEHTARLGFVQTAWQQASGYNPVTGQPYGPPDVSAVFERAFDMAMADHPELRQRLIDQQVAQKLAAERAAAQAADGKRAKAASLASVPSAALTRDPSDVRQLSPQETQAAIAKRLSEAMNGSGN